MSATEPTPLTLPLSVKATMALRLFAIQGVWTYETMIGNGIAFAMEPALRRLPGGPTGERYRTAMVRNSGYFYFSYLFWIIF